MKTSFLVFRHQVVENPEDIFYGVSRDLPISEEGKAKARESGRHLAEVGVYPSVFVVSNLTRAQQTALEIQQGTGKNIPIKVDGKLIDVSYPDFEGRSVDEKGFITLEDGISISLDQMDEYSAETPGEAGTRFAEELKVIAKSYEGEIVCIVSHGDPIAWGLELLRNGEKADFAMQGLMDKGAYPAKGDLAVFRLDENGSLYGNITFKPEYNEIPTLLELPRSNIER